LGSFFFDSPLCAMMPSFRILGTFPEGDTVWLQGFSGPTNSRPIVLSEGTPTPRSLPPLLFVRVIPFDSHILSSPARFSRQSFFLIHLNRKRVLLGFDPPLLLCFFFQTPFSPCFFPFFVNYFPGCYFPPFPPRHPTVCHSSPPPENFCRFLPPQRVGLSHITPPIDPPCC